MDNPTQFLRKYMQKNHPRVKMGAIRGQSGEKIAVGWGNVLLGADRWSFRMMIPRSAPEEGRPLCTMVKRNNKVVWEFEEDHKTHQGVRDKMRVHLHELTFGKSSQFALIEVLEGDPDRLTRSLRIDGDEFSLEVEVLMKAQIGRLWGMKVRSTADERRALDRLMQPKTS